MKTAAAANEYKSNFCHDFTLADAYDAEYVDAEEARDAPKPRARRDEEAAPLMGVSRPKGERVGPFLI
jgi:hypothetical protein